MSSIIRVTDEETKKSISQICNQDYVARAPELWIFLVDTFRNYKILEEKGEKILPNTVDVFFQGFTDSALLAQTAAVLAESLGLGTVFLGSILNDTEKMIELLKLPKYTFPVLGLAFGKINQDPLLKPRMKAENRFFENEYKIFDSYLDMTKDYDQEMLDYFDLRDKENRASFTDQVVKRMSFKNQKRNQLLQNAKKNGFDLY